MLLIEFLLVGFAFFVAGFLTAYTIFKEKQCEHEKALMDEIIYGTGILINGKRVSPEKVFIQGDVK